MKSLIKEIKKILKEYNIKASENIKVLKEIAGQMQSFIDIMKK